MKLDKQLHCDSRGLSQLFSSNKWNWRVNPRRRRACSFDSINLYHYLFSRCTYATGRKTEESSFDFHASIGEFYLPQKLQTFTGAHPASYSEGTAGPFPRAEDPGRETGHYLLLLMSWDIPPLPHTSLWRAQGQLYLTSLVLPKETLFVCLACLEEPLLCLMFRWCFL
jgi:hypothetical protein